VVAHRESTATITVSVVTASIRIAAPPNKVWDLVMDSGRLGEWVTIHRRLIDADPGPLENGFQMEQMLHVRGVNLTVHWRLIECRPHELAVWEGRGPARSRARTEYHIAAEDHATRFDYRNEFHPPLGAIGALASRALARGMPEREAKLTLDRLRNLLEQPDCATSDNRTV
jgi:uncharacterized protein YndB with AHSA1/START domain